LRQLYNTKRKFDYKLVNKTTVIETHFLKNHQWEFRGNPYQSNTYGHAIG